MLSSLESKIGYTFRRPELLKLALTHSSWSNEQGLGHAGCNERLEFLGDSVLGFTTAEYLFHRYPEKPEGSLSPLRADYVCETNLAVCAAAFDLGSFLLLGKGESQTGGRTRPSVVSDAFESLIAAIYLDGGFEPAKNFIYRFVLNTENPVTENTDYKSSLQEYIQQKKGQVLEYRLAEESGPDHNRSFRTEVLLNGTVIGTGAGKSKKKSEQEAARVALLALKD